MDSEPFTRMFEMVGAEDAGSIVGKMTGDAMLKTLPLMQDIANVAVFVASPLAGKITGTTMDVTCGTTGALNYKPNYQADL